jgi:hypothetical protein
MAGAPFENLDATNVESGAAYLFRFDGKRYVEENRFTHPAPLPKQQFGSDVDVMQHMVVIGAPSDDAAASDAGAAFTFRHGKRGWVFDQPLGASDAAAGDRLGGQVAMSDSRIFVAADGKDVNGFADWGQVDAWFSPELNLQITPGSPAAGAPVTLATFPGTPGDPLVIAIVDVGGSTMFLPFFLTTFGSEYDWTVTANAPNPLFGVRVGFQALKISATGPIVFSDVAYVDV